MTLSLDYGAITVSDELLLRAYELMRFARQLDTQTIAWQRQGLVPAYPPLRGQEAAQVGAALAIDFTRDMAFPTYREHAVALTAGVKLSEYYASHINQWHGGLWNPVERHFAPLQAVVAGSVLHAVGWAHGTRLDEKNGVAIAFLGDGASSQGDVHEAMNCAAILRAPVVFFVQNNQWALSVPLAGQVAGGSVAARAAGYGIPGIRIDGDDVAEVYSAVSAALSHARSAGQPVVVEAMTYRRGPHATSDDPSRYRTQNQEHEAGEDPLDRAAAQLAARGLAGPEWLASVDARIASELDSLREYILQARPSLGEDMFRYVFQQQTPQLAAQQAQWREEFDLTREVANV
jgi:2-oxoisovalerate dehydrogenase E1 component alpha subunit